MAQSLLQLSRNAGDANIGQTLIRLAHLATVAHACETIAPTAGVSRITMLPGTAEIVHGLSNQARQTGGAPVPPDARTEVGL